MANVEMAVFISFATHSLKFGGMDYLLPLIKNVTQSSEENMTIYLIVHLRSNWWAGLF